MCSFGHIVKKDQKQINQNGQGLIKLGMLI